MQALRQSSAGQGISSRSAGSVRRVAVAKPVVSRPVVACPSYKNKENVDLSRVNNYAKHEKDTGSSEYQVALLSARLQQISAHLSTNKKDVAARRGLIAILSLRKRHLQYLYRKDRASYDRMLSEFGIRSVVVGDVRGASREGPKQ
uniref:Small ribosomal subunit protein uS15c n=1 Tax=Dunaliella tertiolecta TaxID=3047 RepID=A0A7S3VL77_DUNTE|mmetsp:Transcript_4727/g.12957  ORF Transcript_4727/g.12957 Transcript_4727/m.12957 type:complete len:146 (-) Transcript_4727:286-723(-)|eukprot:CAMPEP_0202345526 /NCGR_PEP_ID=MMETSP1126-20121109/4726_1 /ASSEMBLY_ACC=CAM_ASM_000457 /TAXON_ID=3047 /ORGANISM="Dunaliella tertiolecta, Strain CCMP1320" /LENGTH=145 /DNA_ID=CAMNT_0048936841 /DNA_START=98 /DNA_END=535 /DNA_ORIENTATION=-